jgi:hypothetical protein
MVLFLLAAGAAGALGAGYLGYVGAQKVHSAYTSAKQEMYDEYYSQPNYYSQQYNYPVYANGSSGHHHHHSGGYPYHGGYSYNSGHSPSYPY